MQTEVYLTEKLRQWIRSAVNLKSIPDNLKNELINYSKKESCDDSKNINERRRLPFKFIREMYKHLKEEESKNGCPLYLHELLEGSDIAFNEPTVRIRSPELEARIAKLKIQQDNLEYQKLTRNVQNVKSEREVSIASELQNANTQIIAVLNTVLTVIGSGVFTYKAVEYAMFKPNFQAQIISAMIVGTVVFIADLYFIMKSCM